MKDKWTIFISEFIGTALLLLVGLSIVILDFGEGSPVIRLIPDEGLRRLITGFVFGTTGALIAVSPVGKHSGAHINPVVTLAFWLMGRLRGDHAVTYVVAQLAGAIAGSAPLVFWGWMGQSTEFGATLPGFAYGSGGALLGESATTFALIIGLFLFLRQRTLRSFTPLLFPFLYAIMVYLEAPISGTSTNPARSLGPEIISGDWSAWWVYWIGPILGTLAAVAFYKTTWLRGLEIEVAKLFHFEHDPHGIFRRSAPGLESHTVQSRGPASLKRLRQYRRAAVVFVASMGADLAARYLLDFDMKRVVPFEAALFLATAGALLWAARQDKPECSRAHRLDLWLALAYGLAGVRAGLWASGIPVHIANLVILVLGIFLGARLIVWSRRTS